MLMAMILSTDVLDASSLLWVSCGIQTPFRTDVTFYFIRGYNIEVHPNTRNSEHLLLLSI